MAGRFLKGRKNIYVPIREIGSGGTAQVSLAVELPWGKYRAVKIREKESASGLGTLEAEAFGTTDAFSKRVSCVIQHSLLL